MEPDLLPCPFCGGEAERIDMNDLPEDDPNVGGSCICCNRCGASSPVHFDRKENLCSSWNDRAGTPPGGAATSDAQADKIERLREALQALVDEYVDYQTINNLGDPEKQHNIRLARAALATPPAPGGTHDD